MPPIYSKTAADVFAPLTAGGVPRKISAADAARWGTEVESNLTSVTTDVQAQVDAAIEDFDDRADDLEALINTFQAPYTFGTPVALATTANITLSGEQTIDGTLTSATRILVKNQSTGSQNGVYVTAAGAWSRATDADTAAEISRKAYLVSGGTANGGKAFQNANDSSLVVGSTALVYNEIPGTTNLAGFTTAVELSAQSASSVGVLEDHEPGLVLYADFKREAGFVRDRTTAANNKAGIVSAFMTFARTTANYRVNAAGNFASNAIDSARTHYKNGQPAGLLLEYMVINRLTYSNDFTNASWTKANVTVTAASVTKKGLSMSKLEATASAATALTHAFTGSAVGTQTIIWHVAKGSGATDANKFLLRNSTTSQNYLFFSINYDTLVLTDLGSGTSGNVSIVGRVSAEDMGDGLIRIVAKMAWPAGNSGIVYCGFTSATETAGEYLYASEINVQDYNVAALLIPTTSATVTKGGDNLSIATSAITFNGTAGTIGVEWGVVQPFSSQVTLYEVSDGTANNTIGIYMDANGLVFAKIVAATFTQCTIIDTVDRRAGGKALLAFLTNDVQFVVNDATVGTDTSVTLPTGLTILRVGSNYAGAQQPNGVLTKIWYYNRRLASAEIVTPEDVANPAIVVDDAGKLDYALTSDAFGVSAGGIAGPVYEKTVSAKQKIFQIDGNGGDTNLSLVRDPTNLYNDTKPFPIGEAILFASDRDATGGAAVRAMRMLQDGKSIISARGQPTRPKVYLILGMGESTAIGSASSAQTPNTVTTAAYLNSVLTFQNGARLFGTGQTVASSGELFRIDASHIDYLIPAAAVRDSSAYGETHLETLGYRLMASGQRSILAAPGIGGSTIDQIYVGSAQYLNALDIITRAVSIVNRLGWDLEVVATWNQGANSSGETRTAYATKLRAIYTGLLADVLRLNPRQTAFHMFCCPPGTLNQSQVPLAQWDISKEFANFHLAGPLYEIPYIDTAHPTYLGYTMMGDIYWRAMKRVLIDGLTWKPLQPISAVRTTNTIDLLFEGQTGAIAFESTLVASATDRGIEYADDTSSATITGTTLITDGVRVTLSGTPSGANQKLRGAWTRPGTVPALSGIARTNIVDSDTMTSTQGAVAMPKRAINFEIAVTT